MRDRALKRRGGHRVGSYLHCYVATISAQPREIDITELHEHAGRDLVEVRQ
jgi:hypothetical protein